MIEDLISVIRGEDVLFATLEEIDLRFREDNPACNICGCNPCLFQCPNSPNFYSAEQEFEDSMAYEGMSDAEWLSAAHAQYRLVHGEDYCS